MKKDIKTNKKLIKKIKTNSIEKLYLNLTQNYKEIFECLKNNISIKKLELKNYNNILFDYNYILFDFLKYNNTLTSLNLENNKIENIDILSKCLKYNTSLTELNLNNNYLNYNYNINILNHILNHNITLTKIKF